MDLAINNQQRLMCHKSQPTNRPIKMIKKPGRLTMVGTSAKLDLVDVFILPDRISMIVDSSEQVWFFEGAEHRIMDADPAFSKVSCRWVSPGQCKVLILKWELGKEIQKLLFWLEKKSSSKNGYFIEK